MYPGAEGGNAYFQQQTDYKKIEHERLHMLSTEEAIDHKPFDVNVIGSGAGGGVAAAELSKAGLSVLVIEKGKYYHQDGYAYRHLFENGGTAPNAADSVNFLAASTFGGGTTINYLASIPVSTRDILRCKN
jgi:aspartate oxidase